jgi:hypothetical protein
MRLPVLVCGGRHYADRAAVFLALDKLAEEHGALFVIEGGAAGADRWAREWRIDRLHPGKTFPADWEHHGKGAGPRRNRRMLEQGRPRLVLAFPGGRGTADMIEAARKAGVPVKRPVGPPESPQEGH